MEIWPEIDALASNDDTTDLAKAMMVAQQVLHPCPLVCRSASHRPLEPLASRERTGWVCPDCGYTIPHVRLVVVEG